MEEDVNSHATKAQVTKRIRKTSKCKLDAIREIKLVRKKVIYLGRERSPLYKHRHNIRAIMQFSNATPIAAYYTGTGFSCGFCRDFFHKAADLKSHTIAEHEKDRVRFVQIMKPLPDLTVKLDITDLQCSLCRMDFDMVEPLIDHLNEAHDKGLFTDIKNQIVCFKFDGDVLKCIFCRTEFISFRALHIHMNQHYRNFICEVCAAGFVTQSMLDKHSKGHITGEFKCRSCNKVFETKSKMLWHERLHTPSATFGCIHCGEKFATAKMRKEHMKTVHGAKYDINCPDCERQFSNKSSFWAHRRRDHLLQRKFECEHCDMRFFSRAERDHHMVTHTDVRDFLCEICCKAFKLKKHMRQHMRTHANDRPSRSVNVAVPEQQVEQRAPF